MTESNVDRIRHAYDAWNRRDIEAAMAFLDEDVEWEMSGAIVGTEAAYRGHEGVRRWWLQFLEPFDSVTIEPLEVIESRADVVLVRLSLRATGRQGIEVDLPISHLYELRGGKAVRVRAFMDHAAALDAAGAGAG